VIFWVQNRKTVQDSRKPRPDSAGNGKRKKCAGKKERKGI
jgi:hypothetical protein